jgi:NAD(P)-dependent dehydrogenase (short-subunit alcohol dehydrogenase family)
MGNELRGKVTVVTGAAQGIGRATATALAARGASVLAADLNTAGAESAASAIADDGGNALAYTVDVTDEHGVGAMIADTVDRWGRLDVLVNNAHTGQADDTDVVSTTHDCWERTLAGTLFGVVYGCKYAVPAMIANGGGSIVNVSSNAALGGDFTRVAYASAKAGVVSVTRYTATAFGKRGIRCNAVSPGVLLTPAVFRVLPDDMRQSLLTYTMATRFGAPEDAAGLIAFLASDVSEFINGQVISVDGAMNTALGPSVYLREQQTTAR